jgi:hypothetical protein
MTEKYQGLEKKKKETKANIFSCYLKKRGILKDLTVYKRIILKWVLNKQLVMFGLDPLVGMGPGAGFCEHDKEIRFHRRPIIV